MKNEVLNYLIENIYTPNNMEISNILEEKQNSKYSALTFNINNISARFRISNTTPTKSGQFVAFWQKNTYLSNEAFYYENAPDILIVTCIDNNNLGQFIFPKDILLRENILKSKNTSGKMGLRIYPTWDVPTTKQGLQSQKWQCEYFIDLSNLKNISKEKLIYLYKKD